MKCTRCGAELIEGARFCHICTHPVTTEPVTTEPVTAEPVTTEPVTEKPVTVDEAERTPERVPVHDPVPDPTDCGEDANHTEASDTDTEHPEASAPDSGEEDDAPTSAARTLRRTLRRTQRFRRTAKGGTSAKKRQLILLSVTALILVIALIGGVVFLFTRVSAEELQQAKDNYQPPAQAVAIDTTLSDPSDDQIKFNYDDRARIVSCAYKVNDMSYDQTYSYDDDAHTVTIDTAYRGRPVTTAQIDYESVGTADTFVAVDGYYLRLDEASLHDAAVSVLPTAPVPTRGAIRDVNIADYPELNDFIYWYGVNSHKDFDCRRAAANDQNMLTRIVSIHPCVRMTAADNLYPGNGYTQLFGDDAKARVKATCPWHPEDSRIPGMSAFDKEEVDWICKNIFNLTDRDIKTFYNSALSEQKIWEANDCYNILSGGVGGYMLTTRVQSVKSDGRFFYVVYNVHEVGHSVSDVGDLVGAYYAVLEQKTIDREGFWSLYYHSDVVPSSIEPYDP